jgi:putative phosphoesterase
MLNQQTDFSSTAKKIAIVSDTHEALNDNIANIVKQCDIAIHAGDIGCNAVLETLQPKLGHVIAIAGNNDKPYLWDYSEWDIVKNLPQSVELSVSGGLIAVEHGHLHDMYKPSHDDLRQAHPNARLIVYGHTHIQVIDKEKPGQWVVNPGASGQTRTKGGPSCMVLSIDNDNWDLEAFRFADCN